MADLTQVSEELLWVLLEEELGYFGVLQAPCPAVGGHAGRAPPPPPEIIWACDCDWAAKAPGAGSSATGRRCTHEHLGGRRSVFQCFVVSRNSVYLMVHSHWHTGTDLYCKERLAKVQVQLVSVFHGRRLTSVKALLCLEGDSDAKPKTHLFTVHTIELKRIQRVANTNTHHDTWKRIWMFIHEYEYKLCSTKITSQTKHLKNVIYGNLKWQILIIRNSKS